MSTVFLSHASEDGKIASRLLSDLTRAGVDVWDFERQGRPGVDFKSEYRRQIDQSHCFCLLDSQAARASPHVRDECAYAALRHQVRALAKILVCVVTRPGEWRQDPELFPGQNQLTYLDLCDYERALTRLGAELGIVFLEGELPRDKDFVQELCAASIGRGIMDSLLDQYREFRRLVGTDRAMAEAQLRVLVHRCTQIAPAELVSPSLALGVMLGERGDHAGAETTFRALVRAREREPRAWAGLGGAQFFLGKYVDAAASYDRCCQILLSEGPQDRETHEAIADVTHNLARTLMLMGHLGKAEEVLARVPGTTEATSCLMALRGRILLEKGLPAEARSALETAYWESHGSASAALIVDLSRCYQALEMSNEEHDLLHSAVAHPRAEPEVLKHAAGRFIRWGQEHMALRLLDRAAKTGGSLEYRVEAAVLCRNLHDVRGARLRAAECLDARPETPVDHYYRGLALHLLGASDVAARHLEIARANVVVAGWPAYEVLLSSRRRLPSACGSGRIVSRRPRVVRWGRRSRRAEGGQ